MNDIQDKLLEIAKEYIKVCEKINLRYFALGGTALGAMRHNGFIPWDYDINFCMPREDYDRFVKEKQKLLPEHLFIQAHETEKKYFCPFAKIRDCNTTAIENADKDLDINHGLWIDIFPLDGMPTSLRKRKWLTWLDIKLLRRRFLSYQYVSKIFHIKIVNFLIKIILPSKCLAYKISKRHSIKYKYESSELIWWNWNRRSKMSLKKVWFDNYKLVSFEDIQIRVPYCCEEYLTEHFGDWHKLPPIEEQKSVHHLYKIDLENSYLIYYKESKYE